MHILASFPSASAQRLTAAPILGCVQSLILIILPPYDSYPRRRPAGPDVFTEQFWRRVVGALPPGEAATWFQNKATPTLVFKGQRRHGPGCMKTKNNANNKSTNNTISQMSSLGVHNTSSHNVGLIKKHVINTATAQNTL